MTDLTTPGCRICSLEQCRDVLAVCAPNGGTRGSRRDTSRRAGRDPARLSEPHRLLLLHLLHSKERVGGKRKQIDKRTEALDSS